MRSLVILGIVSVGCSHSKVVLLGASAPAFDPTAGPDALAKFAVGTWKGQTPMEGILEPRFLRFEANGTVRYSSDSGKAEGTWYSNGSQICNHFTKAEYTHRYDDQSTGEELADDRNTFDQTVRTLAFMRVGDGMSGLTLDQTNVHYSDWERVRLEGSADPWLSSK